MLHEFSVKFANFDIDTIDIHECTKFGEGTFIKGLFTPHEIRILFLKT